MEAFPATDPRSKSCWWWCGNQQNLGHTDLPLPLVVCRLATLQGQNKPCRQAYQALAISRQKAHQALQNPADRGYLVRYLQFCQAVYPQFRAWLRAHTNKTNILAHNWSHLPRIHFLPAWLRRTNSLVATNLYSWSSANCWAEISR